MCILIHILAVDIISSDPKFALGNVSFKNVPLKPLFSNR